MDFVKLIDLSSYFHQNHIHSTWLVIYDYLVINASGEFLDVIANYICAIYFSSTITLCCANISNPEIKKIYI